MSYMSDPLSGANGEEPPEAVWGGSYRSTYYYLLFYLFCTMGSAAGCADRSCYFVKKVQRSVDCGNIRAERNQQDGSTRSK